MIQQIDKTRGCKRERERVTGKREGKKVKKERKG